MTAFEQIQKLIEEGKSFVLEAGAGSGKTYTLIQTLKYLIQNKGEELIKSNQKIVCITYTNVVKMKLLKESNTMN
ncbi:MAG: UvrD-helicase domain-containing protein [Cytophagales bacterium]